MRDTPDTQVADPIYGRNFGAEWFWVVVCPRRQDVGDEQLRHPPVGDGLGCLAHVSDGHRLAADHRLQRAGVLHLRLEVWRHSNLFADHCFHRKLVRLPLIRIHVCDVEKLLHNRFPKLALAAVLRPEDVEHRAPLVQLVDLE